MKILKSRKSRFLFFLLIPITAFGQKHVYVNANNLILRDHPQKKYKVCAILKAPCELNIIEYEAAYKKIKAVTDRFYEVFITNWNDENKINENITGWVEKKFTVKSRAEVTVKGADTVKTLAKVIPMVHYMGPEEGDPNKPNYSAYPDPKYKGGEKKFPHTRKGKKVFHSDPKGCYYTGPDGNKHYVDPIRCK